jgi:uncharacterized membrane protein
MTNLVLFFHVLMAIFAFGFNLAYSVWFARAARHPEQLKFALRGVKFMDDFIANPASILLLISGLALVALSGNRLTMLWLLVALITWVVAMVLAYLVRTPTLSRHIEALAAKGAEGAEYKALNTRGTVVGIVEGVPVALILVMKILRPGLSPSSHV